MTPLRIALGWVWRKRRWFFAAYLVLAVTRIPARTGFRLTSPACDMGLTMENAGLSLTKIPHIVLFGLFFLLTVAQFDRVDRRTVSWSLVGTAVLGLLVEIEEGATRTGNCRFTDVLPDIMGALIVAAFLILFVIIYNRARQT